MKKKMSLFDRVLTRIFFSKGDVEQIRQLVEKLKADPLGHASNEELLNVYYYAVFLGAFGGIGFSAICFFRFALLNFYPLLCDLPYFAVEK